MMPTSNFIERWPLLALLSVLPWTAQAGLFTSPFNPTYNIGPESAWMNPAGMTGVKTFAASPGVAGLFPIAKFDSEIAEAGGGDGNNSGVDTVLPTFFAVVPVADKFRVGLSVFPPLGGPDGMGWDFGDNFAGRYGSQGLTFASTAVAGSVAWQVTDKWSIGAGGSWQWLEVNQSTAINTPFSPGDGKAKLEDLNDWVPMYFVGLLYQMSPATSFGLVYRSKWEPDLEGDLKFSGLSVNVPTADFELDIVLPQGLEFGIQQALSETLILGLTFVWQDWTQFNNIVVDFSFENGLAKSATSDPEWKDAYFGGISLTKIMGTNFIQAGINYSSSPVSDSDRVIQLPADETLQVSLGVAHNRSKTLTYSLGGAVVFSGNAKVDQVTQGFRFKGKFDTNVIFVLGGNVALQF